MDLSIEESILYHLFNNEEFLRKTVPFLEPKYWTETHEQVIFSRIKDYVTKYNKNPAREEIFHEIETYGENISDGAFTNVKDLLTKFGNKSYQEPNVEWLLDSTEKWCQERAIYNGIMDSIHIIDGSDKLKTKHSIPEILTTALGVSFDSKIGHDYINDSDARYDDYTNKSDIHIPFDIEYLNKITDGGLVRKTLNVLMSGTGVGKTLAMCHFASSYLTAGKNVLYITCEMSDRRIAERIDANLLDVNLSDLKDLPKETYQKKFRRVQEKVKGNLFIKEYPTGMGSSVLFKHLIDELKTKKKFVPDIIFVDYMNICTSSRVKSSEANSYTTVKSIAEELRGLAVENNIVMITATQVNRGGYSDSDFGLEDTSESFGIPMTADLFLALIVTEELDEMKQIVVKQLKNRYRDATLDRKFLIGIDKPKMRLYDLEPTVQRNHIQPSGNQAGSPVANMLLQENQKTKGKQMKDFGSKTKKVNTNNFDMG